VDTSRERTTPDSAVPETRHERNYSQFDCVGNYLWIRERLIQAEGKTEIVGRQVHRDCPPSRRER
jgi:hypothetical protein